MHSGPYPNPEKNVFDKAFNERMDMDEWEDWMKWEGSTAEVVVPILQRPVSDAGSISFPESWTMDQESSKMESTSNPSLQEHGISFGGTPLGFTRNPDPKFTRPGPITRASSSLLYHSQRSPSLTSSEILSLQNIAMPYTSLFKASASPSPPITPSSASPSPSAPPEKQERKPRKRKLVVDEEIPDSLCQSRKRGHNAIEVSNKRKGGGEKMANLGFNNLPLQKRYRTNLNDKITLLREALPTLQRSSSNEFKAFDDEDEASDQEHIKSTQQKCGKATTLTMALSYIKHLELATQRLSDKTTALQTRIGAFEKLVMRGGTMRGTGQALPPGSLRRNSETLESIQAGMGTSIHPPHKSEQNEDEKKYMLMISLSPSLDFVLPKAGSDPRLGPPKKRGFGKPRAS
jgi:hypothetical protein